MTEYSFYNCISTGIQRQDKANVAPSELSARMPIMLSLQK